MLFLLPLRTMRNANVFEFHESGSLYRLAWTRQRSTRYLPSEALRSEIFVLGCVRALERSGAGRPQDGGQSSSSSGLLFCFTPCPRERAARSY